MKPARAILGAAALLALAGCFSAPGRRVEQRETARDQARGAVLREAQVSAHETVAALAQAPASRPVEVASRSAGEAAALLDHANGGLDAAAVAALRERIAGLLSENEQIRAAAERDTRRRVAEVAEKSAALQAAQAALETARQDLEAAYAREHELAQKYRRAQIWGWVKWGAMGLGSASLVVLRLYMGNMPAGLGKALASLDAGLPASVMRTVRSEVDAHLTPGAQAAVRKWLLRTNVQAEAAPAPGSVS
jgi:hypothetical protein